MVRIKIKPDSPGRLEKSVGYWKELAYAVELRQCSAFKTDWYMGL